MIAQPAVACRRWHEDAGGYPVPAVDVPTFDDPIAGITSSIGADHRPPLDLPKSLP